MATSSSTRDVTPHEVFLSFRGDTRSGFTSHLFNELDKKGIHTFIDDDLPRGEDISDSLIATIRGSKISIIVFSQEYASSKWCLDELVEIIKCRDLLGQVVWPIFYKVDPSDIRNHKGRFGNALDEFEAHPAKKYKDKLPKWKIALNKAANLSGWHLTNGNESKLIQKVLEAASSKLNHTPLHVEKHLFGIEERLKDLYPLINVGGHGVRVIGIYGIGGIGKTTLAKAVFNKFADEFEGDSFLEDVRESSNKSSRILKLQKKLLFDILGDRSLKFSSTHRGMEIIKKRFCGKRLLIVLDDVNELEQFKKLAGGHDWFGLGSRIIITTIYKHFLTPYVADVTYEVCKLNSGKALQLFSWKAFNQEEPLQGYHELSRHVVDYANGLPLALEVLGSLLSTKDKAEWKSTIEDMESKPNEKVYGILKKSYDALQDDEKAMFLDIACFLDGEDKDYVINALKITFDKCPTSGIGALIDMSLITIESNKVRMHRLVQKLGWQIVHQESPEVDKRSRLWLADDVFQVFQENMGTNLIQGIKLDLPVQQTLYLDPQAFRKMKGLRMLIFRNVDLSTPITYLPTNLRFIDWPGYQFDTLPFNYGQKHLVILNMPDSCIRQLGETFQNFEKLKTVKLSGSEFLTEIPDLSTAPNLETLWLDNCTDLVRIHESVGYLDRLVTLDLDYCCNLRFLPNTLPSKNLQMLSLGGCCGLQKFPKISTQNKSLRELCLSGTAITKLPSSIEHLVALQVLETDSCKYLEHIPSSIYKLHHLEHLSLGGCSNLSTFPKNSDTFNEVFIPITFSTPFGPFPMLKSLNLQNCNPSEVDFLVNGPEGFSSLELLKLSKNKFVSLPPITYLSKLRYLDLNGCEFLESIPKLPSNLTHLNASHCNSLPVTYSKIMTMITWDKQVLNGVESQVIIPTHDIPYEFSYKREGDSISFIFKSKEWNEFRGMIICGVFELDCKQVSFSLQLVVDDAANLSPRYQQPGRKDLLAMPSLVRSILSVKAGHMWLYYLPGNFVGGRYKLSFSAITEKPSAKFISRCGVHVLKA